VALEGFHKYFKKQSDEEREHAEKVTKCIIVYYIQASDA